MHGALQVARLRPARHEGASRKLEEEEELEVVVCGERGATAGAEGAD